jgi:hypothetical protein
MLLPPLFVLVIAINICASMKISFAGTFSSDELIIFESIFSNLSQSMNDFEEDSINQIENLRYSVGDKLLPPLWDDVLPLRVGNYARDRNGRFIVDVWDYKQRMSLYKYLIENVHSCIWSHNEIFEGWYGKDFMTKYDPGNILWGLPLQHGWQYSSGRLLTLPNSTIFTTDSWWGNMNFYLSVIPYLGAVQAGIAPSISFSHNPNSTLYCEQPSDCLNLVTPWADFFQLVQTYKCTLSTTAATSLSSTTKSNFPPPTPVADSMDYNLSCSMESLLSSLWSAHIHSIDTALPLFTDQLQQLSPPEQTFAVGWSNLVDLIAESLFPCNITVTNWLQNCLPHRILLEEDKMPPKIPDLTVWENRGVILVDIIYLANERLGGLIERVWKAMMCTEDGRALGRKMLTFGIYRPILSVEDTVALLKLLKMNIADHTVCGIHP